MQYWLKGLGKGTLEKDFKKQGHSELIYSDASRTGGASYFQMDSVSAASVSDADSVKNADMAVV